MAPPHRTQLCGLANLASFSWTPAAALGPEESMTYQRDSARTLAIDMLFTGHMVILKSLVTSPPDGGLRARHLLI
jgi:hypothetical protein